MKRNSAVLLFIFTLFFTIGSGAGDEPKRVMKFIAVTDIQCGKRVNRELSVPLTNIIIDELVKIGTYTVIDRANRDKILSEQGFQQTCHVGECVVDMGRLLGVGKIVVGNIDIVGQTYLINLQLINVETAAVEYSVNEKCKCDEEGLIDAVRSAARKLMTPETPTPVGPTAPVGPTGPPPPPPPPPPSGEGPIPQGKGAIVVTTSPSGAKILLDGATVEGKTSPLTIPNVPAGEHLVTALMSGYGQRNKTVVVVAGQTVPANIILSSSVGAIHVVTRPEGAEVHIDGQLRGKTPLNLPNLTPSEYQLAIAKNGYNTLVKTVNVRAGKTEEINETLAVLTGEADISSNPPGSDLWVDGKYIGKTPKLLPALTVRNHKIKMTLANHQEYIGEFSVEGNKRTPVPISLTGLPGNIIVSSTPDGADVYIDGNKVGVAPYNGPLPPGNHQVRVSMNGYQSAEETVIIEPNKPKTLDVTLKKGPNIRADMVHVPAGEFMMGCNSKVDKQCENDEKPVHKVYLNDFYIDKYEVTVQQYGACVQAGKCSNLDTGGSCNWDVEGRETHPINCVDWNQADTFCKWAGKRLPTEAEWEKAARGTHGRTYPWGNQEASCSYAIMNEGGAGCGKGSTWAVGSKPAGASPYGAMDMAGNVWEWVADWYDENYYKNSPNRNPTGPGSGQYRVLRGGSWNDRVAPFNLRSSTRYGYYPAHWFNDIGFRCAR